MQKCLIRRGLIFIFVFLLLGIGNIHAKEKLIAIQGFQVQHEIVLPGQPDQIYDLITGDISGWWDHSFSEKPLRFFIEAKPGGGFYEIFDESGDGVKHATVTIAQHSKKLAFEGPLGLAGRAIHMVHTYDFNAVGTDSTQIKLTVNALGEITEDLAKTVDSVWYHFLFERFKPYVDTQIK